MLSLMLLAVVQFANAETVTLKDGSTLHGTVKKADAEAVELETPDGTLSIKRDRIMSINYAKPDEAKSEDNADTLPKVSSSNPAPPTRTQAPLPAEQPPMIQPRRAGRLSLALDIFTPANAGDALGTDFQDGASALAGLGYSVNGKVETNAAVGFRLAYFAALSPSMDFGGSAGYISGPKSEGSLSVAGGGLSGVLGLERSISFFRFLVEGRKRFPFSDRAAFSLGAGIGMANGRVSQDLTCTGSACTTNGSKTTSSASWSGFTWEVSPEIGYRSLIVGLKFAGFPKFGGNSDMSKIEWTSTGFQFGFVW